MLESEEIRPSFQPLHVGTEGSVVHTDQEGKLGFMYISTGWLGPVALSPPVQLTLALSTFHKHVCSRLSNSEPGIGFSLPEISNLENRVRQHEQG